LSSSKTKGEIQVYNVQKDETSLKKIKGYSLNLKLRRPDPANTSKSEKNKKDVIAQQQYLEIPQALTMNLHTYAGIIKGLHKKHTEGFQLHKLLLVRLYSKSVLLHYNQTH